METAAAECRLCSFTCNEFKCLFDNECQTEIYKISIKYFNQSLLDFGVICNDCWLHIFNFHSFQQWILNAQENEINLNEILWKENSVDISSRAKNLQSETEVSSDSNQIEKNHIESNPYACETCGASFTQYGNLRRHIRRKHKLQTLRTWICSYCNKSFKNRSYLERHRVQHHSNSDSKNDKTYNEEENSEDTSLSQYVTRGTKKIGEVIEISSIRKETAYDLESEVKAYEIDVDLKDDMCTDLESSNTEDVPISVTSISKPLKADMDKENILSYDNKIAEWKKYLECPKCKKCLNTFSTLNEHFQSEHYEECCYIVCCDELLYDRRSIVEHLQLHEDPNAFKCFTCGKNFKSSKGLNSHKLQVHIDYRSVYHLHLCYCKRAKELYGEYKVKEQDNEYDTFVCCQRKKKILEDDALIAEWKKDLKCALCNDSFPYYSLMRVHFYHKHPGEKCYISCCDRKISRISDAIEHIRVHLDPKTYQCKVCNVMFSGRSSLSKHMRIFHLDLLPKHKWACNECDKTFKIRQILIRHKNLFHSKKV